MSEEAADRPAWPTAVERLGGGLLVAAASLLVTLVEGFLVALRVGTVRMPVSVAVALVCHPLLTVLMRAATRSKVAMIVPALIWAAVIWPLGVRRAEGDLVITGNNWVSIALLLVGATAFAMSLGLLLPGATAARGSLGGNGPR